MFIILKCFFIFILVSDQIAIEIGFSELYKTQVGGH